MPVPEGHPVTTPRARQGAATLDRGHWRYTGGQVGMAPGIGTDDGYDQRYQVYGLFVHLCCLLESVLEPPLIKPQCWL